MFRHKFDLSSLVAGVIFLGFALRYLTTGFGGDPVTFGWAVPTVLISLGVIALLRLAFRSRRREP